MPLTVYKRGEVYHYRGTVAGRRIRGSTGTSDKARAQRIAAEREAIEWKGNLDGPESVLTFAQASILYRQSGKPTRFLGAIEDYWKNTLVKSINSGSVRLAAVALYPRAGGATKNRHVIVPTQAIINHAAGLEYCRPIKVERFPVTTKVRDPATWEWIDAFMRHSNPHLGALACFMFLTGARISEALSVRWADVDLERRRAKIMQTKVGAERRPHLPQALVVALANIQSNREPASKVFKYSSRHTVKPQWAKACKRAGIEDLTFHACRHGFATSLLHAGVDPITVAKLGGWKTPEHVFRTYGHAMDDDTLADRIIGTNLTQPTADGRKPEKKSTA